MPVRDDVAGSFSPSSLHHGLDADIVVHPHLMLPLLDKEDSMPVEFADEDSSAPLEMDSLLSPQHLGIEDAMLFAEANDKETSNDSDGSSSVQQRQLRRKSSDNNYSSTASPQKRLIKYLAPPLLAHSKLLGVNKSPLYNGARFTGFQESKGHRYEVEVVLQHVDEPNSYLCGYLKIRGEFKFSLKVALC